MSATPLQLTEDKASVPVVRHLLRIDVLMLAAALGLGLCSFLTLRGAGFYSDSHKQVLYMGIGLVAALVISRFDYSIMREYRYVLYGLAVLLNIVVFAMPAVLHSHRWIPLPGFEFQSSEFGKLLLILSIAAVAVDRSRRLSEHRTMTRIVLLVLIPAMIVMKQPDLGTALVYMSICCSILFFMGTGWKHLAALAVLVILAAVIVLTVAPELGIHVLAGYEKQRLTTFINPPTNSACNSTLNSTCYQLRQGLIAIGSGGKTGTGLAASQARGGFLPEANNDFIFASLGEIYGFAGAAVVLSLYALLIWRSLRILTMAKNLYGTLIAGGILAMFMFQIFLNIGMTLGIMPVTGVPLPLLSYGGSSVVVSFLAIGLLQSVYVQARTASAGKAKVLIV